MKIFTEDNILIKDRISFAGFISPYSATVIEKIKAAGMEIVNNQNDADAVLSTNAANNMFYIKPTYGTVSRFGLEANVSSMDQIGVCAGNLDTAFAVLSVIAGHDEKDPTTYPAKKYDYSHNCADLIITELNNFKYADCLNEVYMIISSAEFSNNISRYDGLKYGYRTEKTDIVVNSRSEIFTLDAKLKALMGAYVLSEGQFEKYYLKATKLRRLIKQELDEIFKQADAIRVPDMTLAYLCGFPALIKPDGSCFITQNTREGNFYGI